MFKKYNYNKLRFDEYNTEVLEVLYRKLSRDYLRFFSQMSKLYKRGDNKKKSLETIEKINKTLIFLSHVINGGILTKDDIETVFVLIDEINASRDYFISQSSDIVALRERMEKISKETGVRAEDLNLTQKLIRSGVSQVQKSRREGVPSFLKRTAPGTLGLGKNILGGIGTALTGPFAPILGMAGTVLKDIWNVGKGIGGKIREHKERVIGSQLKPKAFGAESAGFGEENFFDSGLGSRRLGYRRSYGKRKSRYRKSFGLRSFFGKSTKEEKIDLTSSLELFYDKKAYKAKWTKELLQRIKDLGKSKSSGGGLGSLLGLDSNFKLLGAAMLPLLGKVGYFALLAAANVWAIGRIKEFGDTLFEYTDVINNVRKSIEKQWDLQLKLVEKGQRSASEIILDPTSSPEERAVARASRKASEKDAQKTIKDRDTAWADLPASQGFPKLASWWWSGVKGYGSDINKKLFGSSKSSPGVGGTSSGIIPEKMENTKLIKSLDDLSKQLEKNRSTSPVRGPSIGNVFDAADPLLSNFAAGKITLVGD